MLPGFLAPQSVDDQIMDVYVANIVYPNIQNDRLPQRVGCYSADRTTIINAFRIINIFNEYHWKHMFIF
ncbi:Tc5 transposase DNA-binding domain [Popillia japonica]|uniref:Tc5 transposase DNA-binding domain n=1 Tax=Popillia japonica TaxID=7064 RepID=A0AAW1L9W3_POPJA